jgi:hypothetical protein
MNVSGRKSNRAAVAGVNGSLGFAALRAPISDIDDEDTPERDVEASTPGRVAARLLLARLFDRSPSVLPEFQTASPVIIVDVPDRAMHGRIAHQWKTLLALTKLRLIDFSKLSDSTKRQDYDAVFAVSSRRSRREELRIRYSVRRPSGRRRASKDRSGCLFRSSKRCAILNSRADGPRRSRRDLEPRRSR